MNINLKWNIKENLYATVGMTCYKTKGIRRTTYTACVQQYSLTNGLIHSNVQWSCNPEIIWTDSSLHKWRAGRFNRWQFVKASLQELEAVDCYMVVLGRPSSILLFLCLCVCVWFKSAIVAESKHETRCREQTQPSYHHLGVRCDANPMFVAMPE